MRIVNAMVGMSDCFHGQLAVGYGDGNEFAASEFLRRAAFVRINVGGFAADHSMVSVSQRLQSQAIGGSPVEDEKDFRVRPKMLFEFLHHGLRVGIVSVTHRMTAIGFGDGLQNLGMNSGIVVTGKTAGRFHDPK